MTKEEIKQKIADLEKWLKIAERRQELSRLQNKAKKTDLWQDQKNAVQVTSKISELENELNEFETLGMIVADNESSESDFKEAEKIIFLLEQKSLLSGKYDSCGAILSIHAGTGGVDAMDWAMILERMYLRFFAVNQKDLSNVSCQLSAVFNIFGVDRSKWRVSVVDRKLGEEAGIKSASIIIDGQYVYGLLKKEAGVHRLVRLSPFNAKNLRQTSFALVEVLPLFGRDDSSEQLQIPDPDLKIDTFRASGAGGQHVNVTDSAVRITHLPTGIVVSVQNERSQHQNREIAMSILRSKLKNLLDLEKKEKIEELRGEPKQAVWGNQIRSYILQPYTLVKDHRTGYEWNDVDAVLNGKIEAFIEAELLSVKERLKE